MLDQCFAVVMVIRKLMPRSSVGLTRLLLIVTLSNVTVGVTTHPKAIEGIYAKITGLYTLL